MCLRHQFRPLIASKDTSESKYEKNSVSTQFDEGEQALDKDRFYENYMKLLKRLPTKEAEAMKT